MNVKFGTFNLYQFVEPPYSWYVKKDKFTIKQFEEKKAWIKEQILKMDCQIIGFQEVFSKECLASLLKELGFIYFETVDSAKTRAPNDKIYTSTIVAIASKYPISTIVKVPIDIKAVKAHHFEGHFKFQRSPIKATINLPNKEKVTVYVCHLKSNRLNEFEYIFKKSDSLSHKKQLINKALKEKFSPALKQRLCEAASLFNDIEKEKEAVVLMCDLNDKEFSITIDALTNKAYYNEKRKKRILYDAYYLHDKKVYNPHPESKEIQRTPTSYFQAKGNVLDYVFISKSYKKDNTKYNINVISYKVLNAHLLENQNGSLLKSDHAQVVCEVEFVSE